MKLLSLPLIATIVLTLLAAPAGATMSYYTSQSAWEAATSNVFTIDFNDVDVQPDGYVDYSVTGLQLHDVTFSAVPASEGGIQVGYYLGGCGSNIFGVGNNYLCGNTWSTKYFEAALPADVIAVAMNLLPVPYTHSVTLSFSSGDSQIIPALSSQSPVFTGFVFTQPITSVRFQSAGDDLIGVDNFAYAQMEQTPEASTLLLAGVGLASLLLARRLRRAC